MVENILAVANALAQKLPEVHCQSGQWCGGLWSFVVHTQPGQRLVSNPGLLYAPFSDVWPTRPPRGHHFIWVAWEALHDAVRWVTLSPLFSEVGKREAAVRED